MKASVVSPANIAMIKHWGLDYSHAVVRPLAGSMSFNLSECTTHTTVEWHDGPRDEIFLGETFLDEKYPRSASAYVIVAAARNHLGFKGKVAKVVTQNAFPTGAGIASSASGFSALAAACLAAGGLNIATPLGRQTVVDVCAVGGSVSALRSIVSGWGSVQFDAATKRYKVAQIADEMHWSLVDLVVVLSSKPKRHGSADGHAVAHTSPLQAARLKAVMANMQQAGKIIAKRDFQALATMAEKEARMMVDVMRSTTPPIDYSLPESWIIITEIEALRHSGKDVFWTIDAGANPHIITTEDYAAELKMMLEARPEVEKVIQNKPCEGMHETNIHLF